MTPSRRNQSAIRTCIMLCGFTAVLFLSACKKTAPPESTETAASTTETSAPLPTGLVKNAVKHTDESANITKWLDKASTKSPERIAQEEKQAREAKEKLAREAKQAQDAKLAQEAKAEQEARAAALAARAREAQKPAPAPASTPAPAPVIAKTEPTPAASQAPAPAPKPAAPEPIVLKLLSSIQPKFPRVAARDGITEGSVVARLHIDTSGKVTQVDIVSSTPRKAFDSEVINAAKQWKYAPIAAPQTNTIQFNFKLEG